MMKMNKAAKWIAIVAILGVAVSGVITMGAVVATQPTTVVTEQPAE